MNYFPYYTNIPYMATTTTKTGLLKGLLGGIKWGSIIDRTQKVLGIANQVIPLVKQAGPVINNAKTMFKVMNEFKRVDNPIMPNNPIINENLLIEEPKIETTNSNIVVDNSLTFFQ